MKNDTLEVVEVRAEFNSSLDGVREIMTAWRDFLEETQHIIRAEAEFKIIPPKSY